MDVESIKARVFELMSGPGYMPMRKRGLAKALKIPDADYRTFRSLLEQLTEEKQIAERKRGKYGLARDEDAAPLIPVRAGRRVAELASEIPAAKQLPKHARVGRIEIKRAGMGFLLSDPPGNDLFIAAEDLGGALSGDTVAVELKGRGFEGRRGRKNGGGGRGQWGGVRAQRTAGRVIKIIERANQHLVGTFHASHGVQMAHVVPDTRGVFDELDVLPADRALARDHDKVAVELVESVDLHRSGARPTARIVKVFGKAGEADADISAIIENFKIKTAFPDEVLAQAEKISEEIPESELAQRIFYEHPVTFTIDPEDAKDHDDAVAIQREDDGTYTLLVHIADVAHYVPEDGVLDIEARERGTSVYLPGKVYPMLPPKISNNVCSLKEGKLRLTKTVKMTYTASFMLQSSIIERTYIRSAAFLTYDQVKDGLDDENPELVRGEKIYETLQIMRDFAAGLRAKRLATGSLELDMPEAKLLLDEKLEVKGWAKEVHHWAHELIEDMMLAANRAVAEYLVEHELPGLFRIHEEPDPEALKRFSEFVKEFGISLRPPIDRVKLKSVLDRVRGKEYAHTVNLALLTSLKQARYSAECHPHFALNFNRYLHFTSPIRRYPDLIVHRALDSRFEPGQTALPVHGKKRKGFKEGGDYFERMALLRPLASHCSLRERLADQAEKEVKRFRQMQYLRRNMKEAHPGIITGVRDFGLFVELQDCFVEGRVSVRDLDDDYYEYFENQHLLQGRRKRRSFRLGDKVDVRIIHIDLGKKEVDLEIV